jgi:hypothetical protein
LVLDNSQKAQEDPIVYFILFLIIIIFSAAAQINIFLSADRLNIYRLIAIEGYRPDWRVLYI